MIAMCCCCCSCCSHRCGSLYRFASVIAYLMSPNVMWCFVEPVRFVVQLHRFVSFRNTQHYKYDVVDCLYVSRCIVIVVEVTATCIDQQNQRPLGRIRQWGDPGPHQAWAKCIDTIGTDRWQSIRYFSAACVLICTRLSVH